MELEEKRKEEEELNLKHSKLKIEKLFESVKATIKKNGYVFWSGRFGSLS
jgi:hypothetical protein